MKMQWLIAVLACVASTWPAAILAASTPQGPAEDVAVLVEEALAQNPGIESMRARTRELTHLATVSGTWNDPRVSVEYMNAPVDSFRINETPMAGVQFKLQQRLPGWGWTRASKAVAGRQVERSRHERAEAEAQLRGSIESLYWNLTLSRQLEGLTRQHVARASELLRAARAKYEVGRAGQNALLRLQVLEGRLDDDLGDYVRAERTLSAGLARALARDASTTFVTPTTVDAIPIEGGVEAWLESARQSRPELAAIREEVKQQTDAAALSRTTLIPEVDVWVSYRLRTIDTVNDDGTDFFSAGVTIPIPIGRRSIGLKGEAAKFAARDGARARLAASIDLIEAGLISADARWRRAYEKAQIYESSLIPDARAALETTLSDFSVDRAGFSTLYEAEIDLLDLERAHLQAAIETLLQRATVRTTTGRIDLGDAS